MVTKKPKPSHKKPTKEEVEKLAAEAEALKDKDKPKPTPPKPADPPKPDPESKPSPKPEPKPPKKPKPKPGEPDYKKKFSASARENQKIAAKNRKINEAIDKAGDIPEPTDEEMEADCPGWDMMDDPTRKLAKEAVISKRFRENLVKARAEGRKIEKWNEQVDEFIEDPETLTKNPELEGRLDEFKIYATDESNTSIPFKVLVPAFLHNSKVPKKKKGQMFPKGSPGPTDKGKKGDKLTIEEGRRLRETDSRKWKQMLKAGRIQKDPSG